MFRKKLNLCISCEEELYQHKSAFPFFFIVAAIFCQCLDDKSELLQVMVCHTPLSVPVMRESHFLSKQSIESLP